MYWEYLNLCSLLLRILLHQNNLVSTTSVKYCSFNLISVILLSSKSYFHEIILLPDNLVTRKFRWLQGVKCSTYSTHLQRRFGNSKFFCLDKSSLLLFILEQTTWISAKLWIESRIIIITKYYVHVQDSFLVVMWILIIMGRIIWHYCQCTTARIIKHGMNGLFEYNGLFLCFATIFFPYLVFTRMKRAVWEFLFLSNSSTNLLYIHWPTVSDIYLARFMYFLETQLPPLCSQGIKITFKIMILKHEILVLHSTSILLPERKKAGKRSFSFYFFSPPLLWSFLKMFA